MGLMRRIPPQQTETALSALLSLLPDHSSDLLSQVDQPLQVSLNQYINIHVFLVMFCLEIVVFGSVLCGGYCSNELNSQYSYVFRYVLFGIFCFWFGVCGIFNWLGFQNG